MAPEKQERTPSCPTSQCEHSVDESERTKIAVSMRSSQRNLDQQIEPIRFQILIRDYQCGILLISTAPLIYFSEAEITVPFNCEVAEVDVVIKFDTVGCLNHNEVVNC